MSETVILPRNIEPAFPNRCVVCLRKNNVGMIEVKGEAVGFSGYFKWILGSSGRRKVPAHVGCARKLRRRNFWRNVGVLVLFTVLPIVWFALRINEVQMPFEFNKTSLCVAATILFLPIFIAEELRPSPFEFRESETFVTFEFKDQTYAKEFAELNDTEIGINTEFIDELGKDVAGIGGKID
jgi:hypothetical protein